MLAAGLTHLDLQGCAVVDDDVAVVLRRLPHLECLQLSGCKKLSPRAGAAILLGQHTSAQAVSVAFMQFLEAFCKLGS